MKKLEIIIKKLRAIVPFLIRFRYIVGSLIILGLFSFIVFRIDYLSSADINEDRYNQGIAELNSIVFDIDSINRINELRAIEVNVKQTIDKNRTNPF